MSNSFDLILFDLGGVLIELSGVRQFMSWMRVDMTQQELWAKWFASPGVRRYESGRCGEREFAHAVIREFDLSVGEGEFLAAFAEWPKRPFPGAHDLLDDLSGRYPLALLSNTNPTHWHRAENDFGFGEYFRYMFLSHRTGLMKPDESAFRLVVDETGCDPKRILYFDDHLPNVESAGRVGISAYQANGVEDVAGRLQDLGIELTVE